MNPIDNNLKNKDLSLIYTNFSSDLYPLEAAKNGESTLKIAGNYIHSRYDPVKEGERLADHIMENSYEIDVVILYGGGLGYMAKPLFDKLIKNNKSLNPPNILYIEKDIKLFCTALTVTDFSEMAANPNFKIFLDAEKEMIGSFIQGIPTQKVRYFYYRPVFKLNESYFMELQNHINYVLDRKDMNNATFSRFQKLWTKNLINNLSGYIKSSNLKSLADINKGGNAFVIAGGPTLEKSVDFIKKNENDAIIITVDTSYKFLIKNGIKPDIIVTIDPQYWNYKYLENCDLGDTIIVTDPSTYYKIFTLTDPINIFTPNSIFPMTDYFYPHKDKGLLSAGGSVSTGAFDTARIIGSRSIYLFGLDLSYPERKTHFKGAFFENNFLKISNYFVPAEFHAYKYLTHASLIKCRSTDNGTVFSDPKMFIFKKWFDREIPCTDAKVFQPDFKGAKLEGTEIVNIENVTLDKTTDKSTFKNKVKQAQIKNNFNIPELRKKIDDFIKYAEQTSNFCGKINRLIDSDGNIKNKDKPLVQDIENELFSDPHRSAVTNIISLGNQDIILRIKENIKYDENEEKSIAIKTKLLHGGLEESAHYYIKYLNKLLKLL